MDDKPQTPDSQSDWLDHHAELLVSSFKRLTGKSLIESRIETTSLAQALNEAPFALVSHNTDADPVFNYANLTALRLFEMELADFTQLASRKSAEPINRADREALLSRVTRDGFIDDYRGVRISSTGRRFWIEQATVWNLIDQRGRYQGQAAVFHEWTYIKQ